MIIGAGVICAKDAEENNLFCPECRAKAQKEEDSHNQATAIYAWCGVITVGLIVLTVIILLAS